MTTTDCEPTPPLVVETREQLVHLLAQACELEHGVMCEYLFALYSLRRKPDEGLTVAQLAKVARWARTLREIAVEEMLHLALANNLRTAIGAAPHLHRPNFPILSGWYPAGVQIALVGFGERALRHFLYLERPDSVHVEDAEGFTAVGQAQPLMDEEGVRLTPVPQSYSTVGHLYRSIEHGLERLVARYGEDGVFFGPPAAQATAETYPQMPELFAVTDLASAKAAIGLVVEQGEGACGDWRDAHFGKFSAILAEYLAEVAADPSFQPARPVRPAYARQPADVHEVTIISDPLTTRVMDLFDATYETMLQALARYWIHSDETPEEVAALALTANELMTRVLRPLGALVTTLPVGPEQPGVLAGPAFQIEKVSFFALPFREAGWKIIIQRLGELADACAALGTEPGLAQVGKLERNLRAAADRLQTLLEDRTAASPDANGQTPPVG